MKEWSRICLCFLSLAVAIISSTAYSSNYNNSFDIDYAVKSAAVKSVNAMNASGNTRKLTSIAFLGFDNKFDRDVGKYNKDTQNYIDQTKKDNKKSERYSELFNSGLVSTHSRFNFYNRDKIVQGELANEQAWGEDLGKLKNSATFQKMQQQGVQAYLTGEIRYVGIKNNLAKVVVRMNLYSIVTHQLLWGDIITGTYSTAVQTKSIPYEVIKAAKNAGEILYNKLMFDEDKLPECNLFVLPCVGNSETAVQAASLTDIISSELDRPGGSSRITLYASPNQNIIGYLNDIRNNEHGRIPTYNSKQLEQLKQKLEQVYNINPKAFSENGKYSDKKTEAYFQGVIKSIYKSDDGKTCNIIINAQIRNLNNNKLLWSETVEGKYSQPAVIQTSNDQVVSFWQANKLPIIIIGSILAVIIIIILIRSASRPR
ncbi:MAG: hypothetical protein GY756_05280 [bacterium]|nr:hypothetical protein [bacterium]